MLTGPTATQRVKGSLDTKDPETAEKCKSISAVSTLIREVANKIGNTTESKIAWLKQLDPDKFSILLIRINAACRNLDEANHNFDGRSVGFIFNEEMLDQADKLKLIRKLPNMIKERFKLAEEQGHSSQTSLLEIAVSLPISINLIHGFENGNGRTSRLLRLILLEGSNLSDEDIAATIFKTAERKDLKVEPLRQYKFAALEYLNKTDPTQLKEIHRDLDLGDFNEVADRARYKSQFPDLYEKLVFIDSPCFNRALRKHADNEMSGLKTPTLSDVLTNIQSSPNGGKNFENLVRQEKAKLYDAIFTGLMGLINCPMDLSLLQMRVNSPAGSSIGSERSQLMLSEFAYLTALYPDYLVSTKPPGASRPRRRVE